MKRTILSLFSINFLVLYVFSSILMADECEAIRYRFNSSELKNIKALGSIHLGRNIVLADSFLYYDYSDRPIIYVASFNDLHSGQSIGSLYLTLTNLVPIEIIWGKPMHLFAYENLQQWLPALAGEYKQLELIRVYYHPAMYPILKVRLLLMDGTEKIVVVDPEREQIIAQNTLDTLAIEYQLPESINRLKNPAIFGCDAIKTFDSDEWYTNQLDVYEVNTKGDWYGCEPATAINILGYWNDNAWEDMDCKFFHDQSALAYPSEVNLLLSDLAYNMGTDAKGFTWFPFVASGLEKTVADKGYVCDAQWGAFLFDYSLVVDEIDLNRPCHLGGNFSPSSIYFKHAVCAIGYKYAGSPEAADATTAYVIVHDGYKTTDDNKPKEVLWFVDWVNWIFNPGGFMTVDFIECKSPSSSSSTTTTVEATTSSSSTTSTPATTTTDGGGNLDLTACTAIDDLEVRAGEPEYWNNKTACYASIILKNNGTRPIWGLYYMESTIKPEETGWRSMYLDPGQEWNSETISFWAYQPDTDGIRTIITTKATAIYYYADDDEGCQWILDDLYSDGVIDAPIRTRDVSGLDPCN